MCMRLKRIEIDCITREKERNRNGNEVIESFGHIPPFIRRRN